MPFLTILTALFCPYIAHEQTTHNLDYVSSLIALCLTECHPPKMKVRSRAISKSDVPNSGKY